eukprot:TRINITY_DN2834_c0_g1_i1.p1 TRINITY_DN2834_c0_g1~~TRINITY_DN2834_c0_g1_i1.p1  ORF type:complete len:301 (+),score=41.83 TRINITY_DN2834_c0_g1_i1:83-985(+)
MSEADALMARWSEACSSKGEATGSHVSGTAPSIAPSLQAAWRRSASSARPTESVVSALSESSQKKKKNGTGSYSARNASRPTKGAAAAAADDEVLVPMGFHAGIRVKYERCEHPAPVDSSLGHLTGGVNVDLGAHRLVEDLRSEHHSVGLLAQVASGNLPRSPRPRLAGPVPGDPPPTDPASVLAARRRPTGLRQEHYFQRQAVGVSPNITCDTRKPQERHALPLTQAQEVGWYAEKLQQQHWACPSYRWRSSKPRAPVTALGPMDVTAFALNYRKYAKKHPFDAPPFSTGNFRYGGSGW